MLFFSLAYTHSVRFALYLNSNTSSIGLESVKLRLCAFEIALWMNGQLKFTSDNGKQLIHFFPCMIENVSTFRFCFLLVVS